MSVASIELLNDIFMVPMARQGFSFRGHFLVTIASHANCKKCESNLTCGPRKIVCGVFIAMWSRLSAADLFIVVYNS